jgi:hypothetical protein
MLAAYLDMCLLRTASFQKNSKAGDRLWLQDTGCLLGLHGKIWQLTKSPHWAAILEEAEAIL